MRDHYVGRLARGRLPAGEVDRALLLGQQLRHPLAHPRRRLSLRRLGLGAARRAEQLWISAEQGGARLVAHGNSLFQRAAARHYGPTSVLARTWSTGFAALWIVVLLGICLILYYL